MTDSPEFDFISCVRVLFPLIFNQNGWLDGQIFMGQDTALIQIFMHMITLTVPRR